MIIRIKKGVLLSYLALFLIFALFFSLMVNSVIAQCSGTDLWTLHVKLPNGTTIKSSAQQTISPTGGTSCNSESNPSTTLYVQCNTNGTYTASVTCDSCSVHSAVSDTAIFFCANPAPNRFIVKNQSGDSVALFDEKGYVYLRGFNISNVPSLNATPNSYVIRNSTGTVVAYINSSGYLLITGSVSMSQAAVSAPLNSFVIRNSTKTDVAYISSSGNLVLSGRILSNWTGPMP